MPKLPPSSVQKQSTLNRTMLRNTGGGRTSLVAPQPRPLDTLDVRTVHIEKALYSAPADVAPPVSTTPPHIAEWGGQVDEVVATLETAGTSSTTYRLEVDGSLVGTTFSMTSGETTHTFGSADFGDIWVAAGSKLRLVCSAAGSGALGPTVQVRMKG